MLSKIKRQRIQQLVVNICISILIIYFAYTIINQQIQIGRYNKQINMYSYETEKNSIIIEELNKQKDAIKDDTYIESLARQQLGYVKPYEKVFVDKNR